MSNIEISECDNASISSMSSVGEDAFYKGGGDAEDMGKAVMEMPTVGRELVAPNAPPSLIPSMGGGGTTVERIGIETSTDVTIGNQTYFQGTVIIKNMMTNGDPSKGPVVEKTKQKADDKEVGSCWQRLWKDRRKRLLIISALIASVLLIGLIVLIVILISDPGHPTPPTSTTTTNPSTTTDTSTTDASTTTESTTTTTTTEPTTTTTFIPIEIKARRVWSKIVQWSPNIDAMPHPVTDLFLSDTGHYGHSSCTTYDDCERNALDIEDRFARYYPNGDLPYNFMIPNMEQMFEGRGWSYDGAIRGDARTGDKMVYVAMMGTFNLATPTQLQLDMLWSLINEGIQEGYVDPNYQIHAECQRNGYERPGKAFLEMIESWDRWSNQSTKWELVECKR